MLYGVHWHDPLPRACLGLVVQSKYRELLRQADKATEEEIKRHPDLQESSKVPWQVWLEGMGIKVIRNKAKSA